MARLFIRVSDGAQDLIVNIVRPSVSAGNGHAALYCSCDLKRIKSAAALLGRLWRHECLIAARFYLRSELLPRL
jgi:hypothetical protein